MYVCCKSVDVCFEKRIARTDRCALTAILLTSAHTKSTRFVGVVLLRLHDAPGIHHDGDPVSHGSFNSYSIITPSFFIIHSSIHICKYTVAVVL